MKSYAWIGYGALGLSSAAFLNLAPVWADDAPQAAPAKPVPAAVAATPVQAKPAQAQAFDLQMHTRLLLESLQRKLNLTPDQQAAWETWAAAERQSAVQRQQQWQQRAEARAKVPHGYTELSTPERMAQAIAHLRDRQQQLQQALLQLEERQLRACVLSCRSSSWSKACCNCC